MATTTTTTPEVTPKVAPISLTASAISKVKEIMAQQSPVPAGLRVGVVGGGCSGFSYSMSFENASGSTFPITSRDREEPSSVLTIVSLVMVRPGG